MELKELRKLPMPKLRDVAKQETDLKNVIALEKEELITPGQPTAYEIDLWSTSVIFNRGHRIRVALSSSNAPRFEPNPNTGGALPPDPKEKPVVAHQTIFLGGPAASSIVLPQIVGAATP